jgi:hypothetical protein
LDLEVLEVSLRPLMLQMETLEEMAALLHLIHLLRQVGLQVIQGLPLGELVDLEYCKAMLVLQQAQLAGPAQLARQAL